MGENLEVYGASPNQIFYYYVFVFISFIYVVVRYRSQPFAIYIILLFFNGLFAYISRDLHQAYRIFIALLSIYWIIRLKAYVVTKRNVFFFVVFILFALSFILTSLFAGDYFLIVFSQFSRYFIIFSLFMILLKFREDVELKGKMNELVYQLLWIQIAIAIVKLFIMGPRESLVGTIASQGGAPATSLPILGFIFIWVIKQGRFSRKDWLFILGLLIIGYASMKRAVWFILPAMIGLMMVYVPGRKVSKRIVILAIILVPTVFYSGIRLVPTLNPENKIWGSFNLAYALEYAEHYTFGEEAEGQRAERGRGSATIQVFSDLIEGNVRSQNWFGYGLRPMYTTNYDEFSNLGFDITHKGSATGIYQTMVANGYLGIFTSLLLIIAILSKARNRRILLVIAFFILWEYLFYTGIILRMYSLSFLLVYVVIFSPKKIQKSYIRISRKR